MILDGTEDLRVRKTISAIRSNFTEMLLEMPYEKINVKALCDRALINKTTFYRYYPTLDDLLEEIQEEFAHPYAELTHGLRYPDDLEALVRAFMTYSSQQGPLYDAIFSSGAYARILQNVMASMGEERYQDAAMPKGWAKEDWALYISHVNNAQINMYKAWVDGGKKVPMERMVAMAVRLICDGARMKR